MKKKLNPAIIELAAKYDRLANEANFDESKHPRADDGKFSSGGGTSTGTAKEERASRRMSQTSGDVNAWLSGDKIRWADRSLARNDLAHELSAARAAVKSKGPSKTLTDQEKENGRRGVRSLHIAAILQGFTYNPKTHQYE